MCPRSLDQYYVVSYIYKMGQNFLDIRYLGTQNVAESGGRQKSGRVTGTIVIVIVIVINIGIVINKGIVIYNTDKY